MQPLALLRAAAAASAGATRPPSCFQGAAGQRGLPALPPTTPLAPHQAGWAAVTLRRLSHPVKCGGFYGDCVPRMGGAEATAPWCMRWGAQAPAPSPAPCEHSPGEGWQPPMTGTLSTTTAAHKVPCPLCRTLRCRTPHCRTPHCGTLPHPSPRRGARTKASSGRASSARGAERQTRPCFGGLN